MSDVSNWQGPLSGIFFYRDEFIRHKIQQGPIWGFCHFLLGQEVAKFKHCVWGQVHCSRIGLKFTKANRLLLLEPV